MDDRDAAFERLFEERYAPMLRLAYLLVGDGAVAEDLVQDAFASVYRSWDRAQVPAAYLRVAVVNRCRSWARHRTVERRHPSPAAAPTRQHPDELWDSLGRLPPRQRAAIVMRFYEDLPDHEIAAVLGCRPATVRTAVHRGLASLRKELSR